jgi:hypothetical protein
VSQDYDWIKYLEQLTSDQDLYDNMVAAGRAKARENTIQQNAHLWEGALRSVIESD